MKKTPATHKLSDLEIRQQELIQRLLNERMEMVVPRICDFCFEQLGVARRKAKHLKGEK